MPNTANTLDRKALVVAAPLRYSGGSANINSRAINKQCELKQISASNPPQLKAARRFLVFVPAIFDLLAKLCRNILSGHFRFRG